MTFNNSQIFDYYPRYLSQISCEKVVFWIIDNSNDIELQSRNYISAKLHNINYVALPPNPYSGKFPLGAILNKYYLKFVKKKYSGSLSHGISINWVCRNIIEPSNIQFYGFIDDDMIPVGGINILDKLIDKPHFGRPQSVNHIKYLWPGYCFFNRKFIKPKDLNFLPGYGADTGAMNAFGVFANFPLEPISQIHYELRQVVESNEPDSQADCIEIIDGWIHVMNLSNWKNVDMSKKLAYLKNQLILK